MIKRDLYYDRIPTKSLREDVRYLGIVLGTFEKLKGTYKAVSYTHLTLPTILLV